MTELWWSWTMWILFIGSDSQMEGGLNSARTFLETVAHICSWLVCVFQVATL